MGVKFEFNSKTGTLEPVVQGAVGMTDVVADKNVSKPVSGEAKNIVSEEQMMVDPNEDEVVFKKFSDYCINRIDDKATGEWLCYFAGYGLDISFNMKELRKGNATKKIEACLEGINKLFRKIIYEQAINAN